ncbi:aurora kinase A- and ninein-interacting protein [Chanodichthys erythropterus]|uniref:aurora kinase A- and ninein-interacting protein n=1 Tax=Chanodichthys erythropterus TaxID=933992 RepID=UPI00351F4452
MKSSKSTKAKPAEEEECGIWLDTKELKEKKQQKQLTRPISRLLNPLARSGFSVAVNVSFTQTKLNMPVTRQSTISSFFSPKSRDQNRSAAHAGSTHTGSKRKHSRTSEPSPDSTCQSSEAEDWDTDCGGSSAEQRFFRLICGESEEEEPPEKRRHVSHYTDQNVFETQESWNKETVHENPNQTVPETPAFFHRASQKTSEDMDEKSTGSVLTSRPVNQNHRRSNAVSERKTKASPVKRMGKENSWPTSSPFKHRLISSPAKSCRLKEKYTLSPKKLASAETAGETLAALFTQDSEGFCVIAHRDQQLPKDEDYSNTDASVVKEEEEEMLFTQDSEGNMVIKH